MKPKQSQIKFSPAPNPQTRHLALPTAAPTKSSRHRERSEALPKDLRANPFPPFPWGGNGIALTSVV